MTGSHQEVSGGERREMNSLKVRSLGRELVMKISYELCPAVFSVNMVPAPSLNFQKHSANLLMSNGIVSGLG